MQAYTKPLSLWNLVEQHVPLHEQNEIKKMLGVSLVEQSLELHREIDTLLEIWRDMKDEKSVNASTVISLPEPPDQRDRLVQEICFYVDNVTEKAKEKGIDPEFIFKRHNSQILDYVAEFSRPGSSVHRNSSSTDGRETPMISQRQNPIHEVADEVQAVHHKLNFLDIDEVCVNLRSSLEREVNQLMDDIQFLQSCLDNEADIRDCPSSRLAWREPTLSELKEERSLLEKDLLAANRIKTTPQVLKPSFTLSSMVPSLTSSTNISPTVHPVPVNGQSIQGSQGSGHKITGTFNSKQMPATAHTKPVRLVKSPTSLSRSNDTVNQVIIGCDGSGEKTKENKKSNLILTDSETWPELSAPPLLESCIGHFPQPPSGVHVRQRVSESHQPQSTLTKTRANWSGAGLTVGLVRRRTTSPGQIQVVELTPLIDSTEDSHVPGFSSTLSSATSSVSNVNPPPPCPSWNLKSPMQPTSDHAERFRKMVLRCRDGE